MTTAHWIFLVPTAVVLGVAGVFAVVKELREEGFLWHTWVLRGFFLLVTAGVGFAIPRFAPELGKPPLNLDHWWSMVGAIILFFIVFCLEVYAGALNISVIVFGAMTGIIVAHLAYFLLLLVMEPMMKTPQDRLILPQYALTMKLLLSVVFAYLFVLLVHKNRDRFNFIIPYVEFRREHRGASGLLVDTSAVIDGRLADLCSTRIIEGTLIVPKFVLRELQALADSADKLKRVRGRRGIDMLNRLRKDPTITVQIDEGRVPGAADVDAKLIKLAETLGARIVTTDLNLDKVANVQGVHVVNINDVAAALKPAVLPGEPMTVELIREGEAQNQGIGYMDDGTMIVVENAKQEIGSAVVVIVTRLLQTSTGRIIFAKLKLDEAEPTGQNRRTQ
ncbi:MAG: PIN domain-containing protein [Planctomycetota bacterium]